MWKTLVKYKKQLGVVVFLVSTLILIWVGVDIVGILKESKELGIKYANESDEFLRKLVIKEALKGLDLVSFRMKILIDLWTLYWIFSMIVKYDNKGLRTEHEKDIKKDYNN